MTESKEEPSAESTTPMEGSEKCNDVKEPQVDLGVSAAEEVKPKEDETLKHEEAKDEEMKVDDSVDTKEKESVDTKEKDSVDTKETDSVDTKEKVDIEEKPTEEKDPEKEGVLEYLTKHLVPLYEKADKPRSALDFLKNNFAGKEIEEAKQKAELFESENKDLKKTVERLQTGNNTLTSKVADLEKDLLEACKAEKKIACKPDEAKVTNEEKPLTDYIDKQESSPEKASLKSVETEDEPMETEENEVVEFKGEPSVESTTPLESMKLKFISKNYQDIVVTFVPKNKLFKTLARYYANRAHVPVKSLRFVKDGVMIQDNDFLKSVFMMHGDNKIEVYQEQTGGGGNNEDR